MVFVTSLKWLMLSLLIAMIISISMCNGYPSMDQDELSQAVYRTLLMKGKRSPSIGLSLAEYMANPQGGESFHFIPGGRK